MWDRDERVMRYIEIVRYDERYAIGMYARGMTERMRMMISNDMKIYT